MVDVEYVLKFTGYMAWTIQDLLLGLCVIVWIPCVLIGAIGWSACTTSCATYEYLTNGCIIVLVIYMLYLCYHLPTSYFDYDNKLLNVISASYQYKTMHDIIYNAHNRKTTMAKQPTSTVQMPKPEVADNPLAL